MRQPAEKDDCPLCQSDALTVAHYRGIAFYPLGHPVETTWEDDPENTTETTDFSRLVAVMVGDDRRHILDLDDCQPLAPEAFCDGCGQIDCGHGSQGA